ncbi:hypothetical protein [Paraburkholderia sp. 2C]
MTKPINTLSTEDLLTRNASLCEASKAVLEAIQRYQTNLRIFGALGRSFSKAHDFDRPYLVIALNDAIAHAEMEVDGEVAMLENCLRHETVSVGQFDAHTATCH